MKSYHNTNGMQGSDLLSAESDARSQEDKIYELFQKHNRLTASKTWNLFKEDGHSNTPLTSIRRAITNLCTQDKLTKTEDTVIGLYGKPEHIYKLKTK